MTKMQSLVILFFAFLATCTILSVKYWEMEKNLLKYAEEAKEDQAAYRRYILSVQREIGEDLVMNQMTTDAETCPSPKGIFGIVGHCNQYVLCQFWTPTVYSCSDGLLFNNVLKRCDVADQARCVSKCPAPSGTFSIKGFCKYYMVCINGAPNIFSCPIGMHFNRVKAFCDIAERAGCVYKCRRPDGLSGIPGKCNMYIDCKNGIPEVKYCPNNLHFSRILLSCVSPRIAKCNSPLHLLD